MTVSFFTFASFALFTAIVGLISFWITRRAHDTGASGYFMASGGLSGWFIAGSMLLVNLSLENFVGLNGDTYAHNFSAVAWEVTAVLSIVLLALVFLPRYMRGGFVTLPQFLEERFDAGTRRIVSALFIVGYTLVIGPSGLYLGAIMFGRMFSLQPLLGLSYPATIAVLAVAAGMIGAVYAVFGGLRGVAVSDTIYGVCVLAAGLAIPVLGLIALGHGGLPAGLREVLTQAPDKLNAIGGPHDSVPFGTLFSGVLLAGIYYWCSNQAIVQRTLAARSLAEGQKGVLAVGLLKMIMPCLTLLPGVIAYHLYAHSPLSRPDLAYPTLAGTLLPFWARGFFGAALFGTMMSHFNSVLNSTATLAVYDFYKPWRPAASDAELVRAGKRTSVAVALLTVGLAPLLIFAPGGIYEVLRRWTGLFNVPIAVIMLMGLFDQTVGARPAKIVLFAHVTLYTVFVIGLGVDRRYGIHYLHLLGMMGAAELALMLALRRRCSRATPYVPHRREHGDLTPWRFARSASTLLLALLVSSYLTFSPFGIAGTGDVSRAYPIALALLWSAALVLAWRFAKVRPAAGSAASG